ncbi:TPA: iron hydrogenase [Candidatus Uhrbacteria bacterium]|uniref:[Fe] hydrogenase, HymD subunit n=2 Tax=Candidatus Uhriibacteriota TaxID=1752732 RepID=A0A0G1T465_9BACT|nr:MAG: [Fe] hydrogenase, HymD subunit [Candidatus Uhrbacteria bacterium GW2011_GWF2_46_218]KKU40220.1 MAG: [Fe] hydrogenase, HymD subunit [Candidatus Uhrbacteria bacterium GW2011_GWE2_46_68]HBK33933.1 iron hydrogenase [Candidatus Uhrbacteria bacterium]HCB19179.1 iron hydrogenase [Candidatus Uhrbacteria bacterium]
MQRNVLVLARDFVQGRVATFSLILALSIAIPSVIHSQYVTGPIVNALLIIATILLGPFEAVLIGLIPSTVALSVGLLPLPLAPMVPFIMIGNALFIACVSFLRARSYPLAITVAALVKFAFLYGAVTLLMKTFLATPLVSALSVMMGYPQFVTALIGGVIAYLFLKGIRKYE